ncbi:hypothetical protein [Bauldia sp.]|uniref:hypothetical protein n=1 Tax=Bauldia sp. TaxID=2575872 RepID=UPI003BA842C1
MAALFDMGRDRYQPDPTYAYTTDAQVRVDQRKLAVLVGVIALGLPIVLIVAGLLGDRGAALGACFYDSISHFYYAQFWGDVFVGALVFIGTFMIAYRGENPRESLLATLAGFCAYGVAVFPTAGRGCEVEAFSGRALADFGPIETEPYFGVWQPDDARMLFQLFEGANTMHFVAAALLFAFLAYYSFFVFTRVTADQRNADGTLTATKRTRNRLYIASGIIILFSMAAIALSGPLGFANWETLNLTFWFEALALWAFGLSWMLKGRFFGWAFLDARDKRDHEIILQRKHPG